MFYHMPSGLCLYILTSMSIGIVERKIVNKHAATMELKPVREDGKTQKRGPRRQDAARKRGFFERIQQKMDEVEKASRQAKSRRPPK
jgi:membrane protein insertase Oxa1/YidC/SpoIIIJ